MSLTSGLSNATSGLANIERQLALLSHNVSNASTPGYVREITSQTALTANGLGMGVASSPAVRVEAAALQATLTQQTAVTADWATRDTALSQIEALQGAPGSGQDLSSQLEAVRSAFSNLLTDPSDQSAQQGVLTSAQTLARTLNSMTSTMTDLRQQAQTGARADIDTLNQTLALIGSLSDRIIQLRSQGQSTADLENQRDAAVQTIAGLVDVKTLEQSNGDLSLFTPSGLPLPTRGAAPFSLADATTPPGASYPTGGVPGVTLNGTDVTAQFGTGKIGAELALRDQILPQYQAALDEFSHTLSQRFADQGLTLFTDPTGAVPASGGVPAQSGYVGYAGVIQVNATVAANPSLIRDGTQAVAGSPTGASSFTPNPPGGPAGFSDLIQRILNQAFGTEIQPGVAQPVPNNTGLGPDGSLTIGFTPTGDLTQFATGLSTTQAQDAAATSQRASIEQASQNTLSASYQSATGVNMDQEMSTMIDLQRSYAANARVINSVQQMWDDLLGAIK